jgi:hypothetical protein
MLQWKEHSNSSVSIAPHTKYAPRSLEREHRLPLCWKAITLSVLRKNVPMLLKILIADGKDGNLYDALSIAMNFLKNSGQMGDYCRVQSVAIDGILAARRRGVSHKIALANAAIVEVQKAPVQGVPSKK